MKSKLKFAFIATMGIAAITVWSVVNNRPTNINSLLLDNIEALAGGESGNGDCLGIGSVDCPFNKTKVYYFDAL